MVQTESDQNIQDEDSNDVSKLLDQFNIIDKEEICSKKMKKINRKKPQLPYPVSFIIFIKF